MSFWTVHDSHLILWIKRTRLFKVCRLCYKPAPAHIIDLFLSRHHPAYPAVETIASNYDSLTRRADLEYVEDVPLEHRSSTTQKTPL